MKHLITGGMGFIGSNFIRYVLGKYSDARVINLDLLTYAGNPENLSDIQNDPRYNFVHGDVADARLIEELVCAEAPDIIFNFAAETHVDRSILDCAPFVRTNYAGVVVLMEAARRHSVGKFVQISTDEIYGSLGEEGKFTEESPLRPNNPYAASKAAADLMVRAFHRTHGLPAIITRSTNNFGPYQFPEKFIPLFVTNALEGKPLPLYGDGMYVRDWIFVEDNCAAIDLIARRGEIGKVYNVSANCEKKNIEIAELILDFTGKARSLIQFVKDRPAHDRRYALDSSRAAALGWKPQRSFDERLRETVAWYVENRQWWEHIKSGEYKSYYEEQYGERIT